MQRLLIVLVLLVAAGVGLGFYLGWFHLSTGGPDGKADPAITLDQEKIKADKEKAKDKLEGFGQKVKERTGEVGEKGKEAAVRP